MSLTFSPYGTIVSDLDTSAYYGECHHVGGDVESEVYEISFPGSSGVLELDSGDRRALIVFRVTWYTTSPISVESLVRQMLREKRYGSIVYSNGVGGATQEDYVRLFQATPTSEKISGYLNGNDVMSISKNLVFKKVRF